MPRYGSLRRPPPQPPPRSVPQSPTATTDVYVAARRRAPHGSEAADLTAAASTALEPDAAAALDPAELLGDDAEMLASALADPEIGPIALTAPPYGGRELVLADVAERLDAGGGIAAGTLRARARRASMRRHGELRLHRGG